MRLGVASTEGPQRAQGPLSYMDEEPELDTAEHDSTEQTEFHQDGWRFHRTTWTKAGHDRHHWIKRIATN